MPKENTTLIDTFKKCNTYTKFVIYRIMQDGFPKKTSTIVKEVQDVEPFFRSAIVGGLESLKKSKLLERFNKTDEWILIDSPYLDYELNGDHFKIISMLYEKPRLPLNLQEITNIPEIDFNEMIKYLIGNGLIIYKLTTFNGKKFDMLHIR